MSEHGERRCLGCHKRLIDENIPYCYRCRLETGETVGTVAKAGAWLIASAGIIGVAKTAKFAGSGSTDDDGGES